VPILKIQQAISHAFRSAILSPTVIDLSPRDEKEPLKVLNIRKLTYITVDPFNDGRFNNPAGGRILSGIEWFFFDSVHPTSIVGSTDKRIFLSGPVKLRL
jgi:hypothetical protein